jgi:hypothetical protein
MNCAQCGAPLVPGAVFCPKCGARLAPENTLPPTYVPAPIARPTSYLAIASIIFGVLCWITLPVVGAIGAIITGHLAKAEIRKSNPPPGGGELATVGLILGYIHLGLILAGVIIVLALILLGISLHSAIGAFF